MRERGLVQITFELLDFEESGEQNENNDNNDNNEKNSGDNDKELFNTLQDTIGSTVDTTSTSGRPSTSGRWLSTSPAYTEMISTHSKELYRLLYTKERNRAAKGVAPPESPVDSLEAEA